MILIIAILIAVSLKLNQLTRDVEINTNNIKNTGVELNKQIQNQKAEDNKNQENLKNQIEELKKQLQAKKASQTSVAIKPPASGIAEASGDDNFYKTFIYNHESGNNPARWNSSGCLGLGQACPASKLLKVCPDVNDYACQDTWFTNYALSRYGSWQKAYQFWISHRWW